MEANENISVVEQVPIDAIRVRLQVRRTIMQEPLFELSASIKQRGVLQPIIVQPVDGGYELVVGLRRLRAAQRNGELSISAAIVNGFTDSDMIILALSENLQREDLTPFEEAFAVYELSEKYGLGFQDIAEKIGKGTSFVRRRLKLLAAPAKVQELLSEGKLSVYHVELLAQIASPEEQERFAKTVAKHSLSDEELQTLIQQELKKGEDRRGKRKDHTGKRAELRIIGFGRYLEHLNSSSIHKMSGQELDEMRRALERLMLEINVLLDAIDRRS